MSIYQNFDTPYPATLQTGDVKDDDAAIIDEFFETTSTPPDPAAAVAKFEDHSKVQAPKLNRMLSGFQNLSANTSGQIQLAWPDPNRKNIHVHFVSTVTTDYVLIGGTTQDVSAVAGAASGLGGRLYAGEHLDLTDYNGPLWAGNLTLAGTGTLSWWINTS